MDTNSYYMALSASVFENVFKQGMGEKHQSVGNKLKIQ